MESLGTVTNVREIVRVAEELRLRLGTQLWWRGHSNVGWELTAGVFRSDRGPLPESQNYSWFRQKAGSRYANCPHADDYAAWLFLMQHYRLRTRLLDWTESILTSTFFVVSEAPGADGALWGLSPFRLNERMGGDRGICWATRSPALDLVRQGFRGEPQTDQVVAVVAEERDPRMLAQLSAFTIHGSSKALEGYDNPTEYLARYTVPAAAKDTLYNDLWHLGIRRSTVFPDLENLARDLDDRRVPRPG